ncbi:hypothetical protein VZT92_013980 [Zoarces viviparus]|uniref:Uncharacterized protein n=1 Tax=Zoarces viviparus TaxID=48416 RepID=A0AAW1EYN4_ZOAVI
MPSDKATKHKTPVPRQRVAEELEVQTQFDTIALLQEEVERLKEENQMLEQKQASDCRTLLRQKLCLEEQHEMLENKHADLNEEFISFTKKAYESQRLLVEIMNAEQLKLEKLEEREAKQQRGFFAKFKRGLEYIANSNLQIQKIKYLRCIQFKDEEIERLRDHNHHLENELQIVSKQIAGVQAQRSKIEKQLLKARVELTANRTTTEDLQEEVSLLNHEADEKTRALDKADQDNRSVKDQLKKVEWQLLDMDFKYKIVKDCMADLTNKLEAVMAEKEMLEKELQHCNETVAQQQQQLQDAKPLTLEEMIMDSNAKVDFHILEKQQLKDFLKQLNTKLSEG